MMQVWYTHSLVVLFLGDLFHLVKQLPDAQLQFGELLLLHNISVVDGVLAHLYVQVNSELRATEPGRAVGVHADDVFSGGVGREGDAAFRAVHSGQQHLVVWVSHLHVHADSRRGRHEATASRIVQLYLVVH